MRKYEPEILMGLIMSLALLLAFPPRGAAAPERPSASHAAVQIDPEAQKASFDRTHSVRLLQGDAVGTISMREYLIGVVLSEMPMSFEPEALRAQAIASRTSVLHSSRHSDADVCDDGACCQCREDEESLRRRFGADYEAVREKAQQAVDSTDGIVLTYGGALIDATYFSCSGGMTEDAREVWGSDAPYLRAVASPGEENAGNYYSRAEFSPEEFADIIAVLEPRAIPAGDPAEWVGKPVRTDGDGVRTLEIGGTVLSGAQLREAFGLRSTNFNLHWDGERFCFDVYGAGHRVGLSQCGAQAMALAGATAEQILTTYYTGVEISHI